MPPVFSKLPSQDTALPSALGVAAAIIAGVHWSVPYRRQPGIGHSPVEMVFGSSEPPKPGMIKINFSASMPDTGLRSNWGGIGAVARNSSGDPLAVAKGKMRIGDGDSLGLELYALKAAAIVAKKLKDDGMHDGMVIYESTHLMVTSCLNFLAIGEPEAVLSSAMPRDLEDVSGACKIFAGDGLRRLPREFMQLVEDDKISAGDFSSWFSLIIDHTG